MIRGPWPAAAGVALFLGGCIFDMDTVRRPAADSSSARDAARDSQVDLRPDRPPALEQGVADLLPADFGPLFAWTPIKAGAFVMGSPSTEDCRQPNAGYEVQHPVTLTHDFEIQRTEVTQGQFTAAMGYNPAYHTAKRAGVDCGADCPVESVTWSEAAAYCNKLSANKGKSACYSCTSPTKPADIVCQEAVAYEEGKIYSCPGYRLPTEAEWEYAYRAGSTTALYNGPLKVCRGPDVNADSIGWYYNNSKGMIKPVGGRKANAWGLLDMAGGVYEWCHDWFKNDLGQAGVKDPWGHSGKVANYRVMRGGTYMNFADEMRAASRNKSLPGNRHASWGFRCVRSTN